MIKILIPLVYEIENLKSRKNKDSVYVRGLKPYIHRVIKSDSDNTEIYEDIDYNITTKINQTDFNETTGLYLINYDKLDSSAQCALVEE